MAAKRPISTIREQVYQILRDDICQGVYAPGTRLQEVDLAENLNVSRSPVREALRQLAADGLLLEIPNKGVYVKEFTAKDIGEIYDLRVMLESYGIFHSAGHITSARRERLLQANREAARFYHETLFTPAGEASLAYLQMQAKKLDESSLGLLFYKAYNIYI